MQQIFAGIARILFAPALAVLLVAGPAWAAQLQWQALPDRERITITMSPSDGLSGPVGRIAPTAVIVPFTEVPSGLYVADTPAGARIFQGTRQQGRSLVFVTQTPEFGYVVSKQTSTELVVDFFPNPLGARWKPSAKAPTTEVPPDTGIPAMAPPDAANQTLAADPQNTGTPTAAPATAAFASPFDTPGGSAGQPDAQTPGQPPAQASAQTPAPTLDQPQAPAPAAATQPGVSPAAAQPTPAGAPQSLPQNAAQAVPVPPAAVRPAGTPEQPRPTVVVLPGTPDHATATTQFAASINGDPPAPDVAANTAQSGAAPDAQQYVATQGVSSPPPPPSSARPMLDSRAQTAERSAPLPLPVPSAAPASPPPAVPQQTAPVQPAPAQAAPAQPAQPTPAQPVVPHVVLPTSQPVPQAGSGSQVQPAQPAAPAQSGEGSAPTPPGVGTRTEGMAYGGTINTGGLEAIPPVAPAAPGQIQPPLQSQPPQGDAQLPAQTPAQAQPAQAGTSARQSTPADQQAGHAAPAPAPPKADAHGAGATKQAAATPAAHNGTATNATVMYVDKDGKPVPPPADAKAMLPEIRRHIAASEFAPALEKADLLLRQGNIDAAEREELLHVRSEMLFVLSKDNMAQQYKDISDATIQAINFNQKSQRNAGALLRLGYMNLKLKNIPEAEARFNMLRRQFPDDENVPLTYYYWGDYHFQRDELQRAADEFQFLLQKYPNSRYAREGALGLARSFYRLGYYQQSFNVVDYIERRWERFYIEYPPFLNMMGDVAFRLNDYDYALKHYWLYANLDPMGEEADIILTRIGDIYSMKGEKKAGKELYNESVRRFPDKDGALVAMMRLSENSVNDDPSIAGMFSVFDGPFNMAPVEVYRTIIEKHPKSSLVPLAEIKLAMWHLWKHQFIETLDTAASFLQKYPDHELAPKAKEIALQTFAILAAESVADGRYGRMREIWERYPIVHGQEEILPAESRVALGVSYWKDGKPDDALKTVEPFFLGRKVPEYSEMALSLVLSIYLEHDQWRSIREVAKRVELWEISPESQQQLDYSLALAAENLNESDVAAPIWQKLYDSGKLPPSQMAYAAFFLARDAERQRELEKAYGLGKEALNRLVEQSERSPNAADLGKIRTQLSSLMDVAETAGRLREALGFAEQYIQYLPAQDSERVAVQYRMARIYRKQGNMDAWKTTLTDIAAKNPGTVYGQLANSELKAAEIAQDAARYSPTGRI